MSIISGPKINTNGLVLCLDAGNPESYPGTGTAWRDLTFSSNNGVLTNFDSTYYTSSNGGGIIFDGADSYVYTPLNIDSNPFSISAWCYPYDVSSTNGRAIFCTDDGGWDRGLEFNGGFWQVHVGNNLINTNVAASANTWYNCCLIYAADNILLYVNGKLVWTNGAVAGPSTGSTLEIGRAYYSGGGGSRLYYGIISVVTANNAVLSEQEVVENYNAIKSRFGL